MSKTVNGSRPKHTHLCGEGAEIHEWECNSPYCSEAKADCPEHDGPTPVIEGHEPWRR